MAIIRGRDQYPHCVLCGLLTGALLPIRYLEKRNRHGQCHNARRLVWFHVPWQLDRYLPRICSSILPCWVYTRFCLDRLVMGLHQAVAALPIRGLEESAG